MSESTELATVNAATLDLPEAWNRRGDVVLAFAEQLDTRWRIATMLVKSGMIREKKPEAVMAVMLKAYEMGVPLMQALGGMYFVDGKVAIEGHLMDALAIQRCGVSKTVKERTDTRCSLLLHREGWTDLPVEYTMDDAARAGLVRKGADGKYTSTKSNWQKHPKQMLYWRALSDGLRQIAPDYFTGTYTTDELEAVAEAHVVASGNRSTMEELAAAIGGDKGTAPVEPDPLILEADEIEKLRNEANNAELAGIIDAGLKNDALDAAVKGEWQRARDLWDTIRSEVMRAEATAPVQQGALL